MEAEVEGLVTTEDTTVGGAGCIGPETCTLAGNQMLVPVVNDAQRQPEVYSNPTKRPPP